MTKHKLALNLSFLTLAALTSGVVAQDTATWNGSTNGDWSNSSNWNSGFVPNGNDVINIAGTSNTTMNNNLTGGALNQYRLFFNAGAGAFTINGSALAFFDFGAQAPKIENNSTNTQTVNANITMDGQERAGRRK